MTLTDIEAHVAPRVAVKMLEGCPSLIRATWTFTNPRRDPKGFWAANGSVHHQQLLHLVLKTVVSPRSKWNKSFPHSIFASVFHHFRCPNLQSLTMGTDPNQKVGPMGESAPFDRTICEVDQWGPPEWHERDLDSENEQRNTLNEEDNDEGTVDDIRDSPYIRSLVFKEREAEDGSGIMFRNPFWLDFFSGFLAHSPALKTLDFVCIPFHPRQIIHVLNQCSNLETLKMQEVQLSKRRAHEGYPEPLASTDLLDWLKNASHLPFLRNLEWKLTRFPGKNGSLEDVLEARYDNGHGSLKSVDLYVGRSKDKAVVGKLDHGRINKLRERGLVVKARSYEIHESG
ncbi:hypothetical protein AAF712_008568 [Marasmius tenuissimus]|uniref:F-box protein n=1 Tax=Marasmius tenuissimus TaxID=585030 RepID=A0ABR2ZT56_9AGAR